MLTKIHSQIQKFMLVETELHTSCIGRPLFYAVKIMVSSTIKIQYIFNFNMSSPSIFDSISLKKLLGARRRLCFGIGEHTLQEVRYLARIIDNSPGALFIFRPVSQLQVQIPQIIKAVHKQLREKSIKTRQGCFSLLTELVQVLPGALTEHLPAVVPGVQFSLG